MAQRGQAQSLDPDDRMTERESAIAMLLAKARLRGHTHLHRVIEAEHPGLADVATIWRYLYDPPKRMDYRVVKAMADVLQIDTDELVAIVSADRSTPP